MRKLITLAILFTIMAGCKKLRPVPLPYFFGNVLILGNSVTIAPPGPTYVWTGNWGMAATAADSDYVHLLTNKLQKANSKCVVTTASISELELHYNRYNIDQELRSYRDLNPDLVIIRIGEEVRSDFDHQAFNNKYVELINYFKTANPKVHIYAVGSFWPGKSAVDGIMKRYSPFVSLSRLGLDRSNYAFGTFADSDVESHPGNKGMRAISNIIWHGVDSIRMTIDARDQ